MSAIAAKASFLHQTPELGLVLEPMDLSRKFMAKLAYLGIGVHAFFRVSCHYRQDAISGASKSCAPLLDCLLSTCCNFVASNDSCN